MSTRSEDGMNTKGNGEESLIYANVGRLSAQWAPLAPTSDALGDGPLPSLTRVNAYHFPRKGKIGAQTRSKVERKYCEGLGSQKSPGLALREREVAVYD